MGAEGALCQSLSSAGRTPAPPQKEQNSLKTQLWRCQVSSRDVCAFVVSGDALPLPATTFFPSAACQGCCRGFGPGSPPCTLLEGNPTSPTSPAPLLTLAFGKWLPVPPYMLPRTVGPRRSSSVPPCPLATGAGSVKLNLPPDTPVQQLHPPNQGGGTELSRTLQRGGKHCETHLIQPAHGASCSPRESR